ncbi:unnamed protein product [Gongylonema pulchrum]|uniref:Apple domain-containing protein n=1 Tax=Gongylonema pulchrum TaxID=637853 RepID=A0A183DJR2_9BILA|nr:unnamed protein product [Gongylonema pulchrum]
MALSWNWVLPLHYIACGLASNRVKQLCYMEPTNRSSIGFLHISALTDLEHCKRLCLATDRCSSLIYATVKSICLLINGQEGESSENDDKSLIYFRRTCQGNLELNNSSFEAKSRPGQ